MSIYFWDILAQPNTVVQVLTIFIMLYGAFFGVIKGTAIPMLEGILIAAVVAFLPKHVQSGPQEAQVLSMVAFLFWLVTFLLMTFMSKICLSFSVMQLFSDVIVYLKAEKPNK